PPPAPRAQDVRRDRPHRAGQAAVERAREVEVPEEAPAQPVPVVAPEQVVAEEPGRDEGLEVQVDHLGAAHERDGVLRHAGEPGAGPEAGGRRRAQAATRRRTRWPGSPSVRATKRPPWTSTG